MRVVFDTYRTTGEYGKRVGLWRREGRPVWCFVKLGRRYAHLELGARAFHLRWEAW